jgi:hypothetical protein
MSIELRKPLYRYLAKDQYTPLYCTHTRTALSLWNSEQDFKVGAGRPALPGFGRLGIRFVILLLLIICGRAETSTPPADLGAFHYRHR